MSERDNFYKWLNEMIGFASVQSMSVTVSYPKHIRFLDMKKSRSGEKKKRYAAIYNKQVYGHLKSGV